MGIVTSLIDQNFPPRAQWSTESIPDLSGKVMIVTGANSGLGKETAKVLLSHGAKVYAACRDEERANAAITELAKTTGKTAIFLRLDLSSLASIRSAAEEFRRRESYLNVLFNNAGVMAAPLEDLTKERYDLQFGVNVLGHFYFTELLVPLLKAGAAQSPDGVARVINTASQTHIMGNLDFGALKDGDARRKMSPSQLYSQSTFGRIVYSIEFARRNSDTRIVSIALHPGSLTTNIGQHINPIVRRVIHAISHSPEKGSLTQLWGGTSPEASSMNGGYLIPWARIGHPDRRTEDPVIGKKLWTWLEDQVEAVNAT